LITTKELFKKLRKLDQKRAKTIDKNNRRRLIRSLEIVIKTKKPIPSLEKSPLPYPVLMIGIKKEGEENKFSSSPFATARVKEELNKLITKRVEKMFKLGLEEEVGRLVKKYGWIEALQTIGYQEWQEYFKNKINRDEVKNLIIRHTIQFAKRQMTWFKRDKRIKWVKNQKEAEKLIKEFLQK